MVSIALLQNARGRGHAEGEMDADLARATVGSATSLRCCLIKKQQHQHLNEDAEPKMLSH